MNNDNLRKNSKAIAILTLVAFFITACASTGSGSTGKGAATGSGPPGGSGIVSTTGATGTTISTSQTPLNAVVQPVGTLVDTIGNTVGAAGGLLNTATTGILPLDTRNNLEQVLVHTGQGINSLGDGIANGIGGASSNPNSIGSTLQGVPGLVVQTGDAITSAGNTVSSLGSNNPLAPVVGNNGAGGLVSQAGMEVSNLGLALNSGLDSAPVSGLTGNLSTGVLKPASDKLIGSSSQPGLTQAIGRLTATGKPADNVLQAVGNGVSLTGHAMNGSNMPLANALGQTVDSTGKVVANTGVLLNDRSSVAIPGNPVGGNPSSRKGFIQRSGILVSRAGKTLEQQNAPLLPQAGQVIDGTGLAVASSGQTLESNGGILQALTNPISGLSPINSDGNSGSAPALNGLLPAVGNSVNSLTSGIGITGALNNGGSSATSLTGLSSGVGTGITSLVGGITGGSNASGGIFAPVTGAASAGGTVAQVVGLANGITGSAHAGGGLLSPVIGQLNSIGGTVLNNSSSGNPLGGLVSGLLGSH